jgi:daunorubicin resistance ABC transporter ATP-binding subunit
MTGIQVDTVARPGVSPQTSGDPAVEVERLRKAYGETIALDDLTFQIPVGSLTGLLGPNGAGKTTAIGCLTTLIRPDGGRAAVCGHDVRTAPAAVRAQISVVGQDTAVDPVLTGEQNLILFGRLLGLSQAQSRQRAAELVERLDLGDVIGKPPSIYSGGLRRRLDLAISLLVSRPVLFLDEPTTGLDPVSRQRTWDIIRDLQQEGRTILLTTQYLDEADRLADNILLIDRGRLRAQGSPDELKAHVGGAVCEIRLAAAEDLAAALNALSALHPSTVDDSDVVTVAADRRGTLADVVQRLYEAGIEPEDVSLRKPTLDDVFFALTTADARAGSPS